MRVCMRCGSKIALCMGFTLARDILVATEGKTKRSQVREHCGKCVEIIERDGFESYFAIIK